MSKSSLNQGPNDNIIVDETILEINEYTIKKGYASITVFISKGKNSVNIRSFSYEIKLTTNGFSIIANQPFKSVDEIYYFIKSIFDQNNVYIQEVSGKIMKLILIIFKKRIELFLTSKKDLNCYIINELFNKYLKLEENFSKINEVNRKLIEENEKFQQEFTKMKNDMQYLVIQNMKNENHINLILSGIDKINEFIDSSAGLPNANNNDNTQQSISLNKSKSAAQNLNVSKNSNIQQSYSSQINQSQQNQNILNQNYSSNEGQNANYNQNLDIYGEEQLFQTQEGRVIYRNGILNGIIQTYAEIDEIVNKIQLKLLKGVKFNIIYKASELGDRASIFHQKCDNCNMTLVIIETNKGKRFGGFTTQSWYGNCLQKIDNNAFIFSIDKNKTYDVNKDEPAVGCYPKFGPVFFGCQIRIYDNFFRKHSTTCLRGLNYSTTEDFELNGGEQKFTVKDIEVYEVEAIDI